MLKLINAVLNLTKRWFPIYLILKNLWKCRILALKDITNLYTKDKSTRRAYVMGLGFRSMRMDDYMKANGRMINEMDKDMKNLRTRISILEHI